VSQRCGSEKGWEAERVRLMGMYSIEYEVSGPGQGTTYGRHQKCTIAKHAVRLCTLRAEEFMVPPFD
jgi:hypothetical protein